MNKQIDIFDSLNTDKPIINTSNQPDPKSDNLEKITSYKITKTKMSLETIGEKLSSRYYWITNSTVPYSASNLIHVNYKLDYNTIYDLYNQGRVITYKVDNTFTTWINKSIKKRKKTNHPKSN